MLKESALKYVIAPHTIHVIVIMIIMFIEVMHLDIQALSLASSQACH